MKTKSLATRTFFVTLALLFSLNAVARSGQSGNSDDGGNDDGIRTEIGSGVSGS